MQPPLKIIATIHNDFTSKFAIPRQSGLATSLKSTIVFAPEYRNPDALRGIEGYSHLWLIWQFSQSVKDDWSPTVRPPKLGGNAKMGVFASRSPFRPNPLGLSCVKLEAVDYHTPQGPVITVTGADLMNKTPIYDIKPYLPYADCQPQATGGFALQNKEGLLTVSLPDTLAQLLKPEQKESLVEILAHDPRPAYQQEPERVYGFEFASFEIKFKVNGNSLEVIDILTTK